MHFLYLVMTSFWCLYLLILNRFHKLFWCLLFWLLTNKCSLVSFLKSHFCWSEKSFICLQITSLISQPAITCSKLTIETLGKGVWNMFKVNNKDIRTTPVTSFWCLIVNFKHISHFVLVFLLLSLGFLKQLILLKN